MHFIWGVLGSWQLFPQYNDTSSRVQLSLGHFYTESTPTIFNISKILIVELYIMPSPYHLSISDTIDIYIYIIKFARSLLMLIVCTLGIMHTLYLMNVFFYPVVNYGTGFLLRNTLVVLTRYFCSGWHRQGVFPSKPIQHSVPNRNGCIGTGFMTPFVISLRQISLPLIRNTKNKNPCF